jgi:hypothetical protein
MTLSSFSISIHTSTQIVKLEQLLQQTAKFSLRLLVLALGWLLVALGVSFASLVN